MTRPLRIGLTGGIASGKSTVTQRFGELGVPVIDADVASASVGEPGKPGLAQVVRRFGGGVLDADGRLDRRALRNLIFEDSSLRQGLDAILHPLIRAEMEHEAAQAKAPYVVMAIPLLVEGGNAGKRVDRVLVVDADETLQLQRLQRATGVRRSRPARIFSRRPS